MKRILVVDDDKTLRKVLTRFLENQGYLVEEASSGVEGLRAFAQNPPDLVVSDVMMPGMNGLDFCRELRGTSTGQLVPFIFLSGQGELEDRIQGHSIGADDYLTKPFEPRELVAKIEAQMERTRRIHAEMVRMMQNLATTTQTPKELPEPEIPIDPSEISVSTPTESLPLTPAEQRVFWEVIQGLTNKHISDRLFISPRTVQTHLSNILGKLDLENRSQLVRFAFERGYKQPAEESQNLHQTMRGSNLDQTIAGLYSLSELQEALAADESYWRPLVFTNGCFDLIHPGHVRYLQVAKSLGRSLVVGLNSDRSVRTIKPHRTGLPYRPIVPEGQRAEVLAALRAVDAVVIFDDSTATSLIEAIMPDIYVKGGDYSLETLPEAPIVQAYGGRIELVKVEISTSTTAIVDRILKSVEGLKV